MLLGAGTFRITSLQLAPAVLDNGYTASAVDGGVVLSVARFWIALVPGGSAANFATCAFPARICFIQTQRVRISAAATPSDANSEMPRPVPTESMWSLRIPM